MRVYFAATIPVAQAALADGELPELPAYAVTPGIREWYTDGDIEELEYAALVQASRASLRLLATDPGAPRRRVVLVAEVVSAQVDEDGDRGRVRPVGPVRVRDLAAGHVDYHDAEATVAAGIDALDDPTRLDAVEDVEGYELQWYATQELAGLD
jgi:hypothetical protein